MAGFASGALRPAAAVADGFLGLERSLGDFGRSLASIVPAISSVPFNNLTEQMGGFSSALRGITANLTGFYDQLASAGSSMGRFVEAFNPSQTLVFGQAMRDLSAVIGRALAPAFDVLTQVVKSVGAVLAPVFEALGQALKPLVEAFGSLAATVGRAFAGFLQAIMPLLVQLAEFLAPVIRGLGALAEAIAVVFGAIAQMFSGAIGKVGTLGEQIGGLLKQFASGLILALAALAKWITGSNSFINALERNLRGPDAKDITGTAAAQGARFAGFSEFGRSMALAASTATAGGSGAAIEDEQKKWREDVLRKLVELKDDEKAREWINGAANAIVMAVMKIVEKTADAYESGVSNPLEAWLKKKTGASKVLFLEDLFSGTVTDKIREMGGE